MVFMRRVDDANLLNEYFYQGTSVAESIPAHAAIKELIRNKQQEVRAYKNCIDTVTTANSEPDKKQRAEAIDALDAHHPNGEYVAGRNISGRMPQHGQTALDEAVLHVGKWWGVEGDRLILFNFISAAPNRPHVFQYDGYCVNENHPAILALAKDKRNKERARKQAIRAARRRPGGGSGPGDNKDNKDNKENRSEAAIWAEVLRRLEPREKVATIKKKLKEVAQKYSWPKNEPLSRKNNRTVYTDKDGYHYSEDLLHGAYEKLDRRGKHLGQYNIDLELKPNSIDPSGGHDILV